VLNRGVIFADVSSLLEGNDSYIKDRDSKREGGRIIQLGTVKVWADSRQRTVSSLRSLALEL
jgi:hypothetical protein